MVHSFYKNNNYTYYKLLVELFSLTFEFFFFHLHFIQNKFSGYVYI